MASAGPLYPTVGADSTAGGGTVVWINPGRVTAEDGSTATAAVGMSATSHCLQGTAFAFSIPAGATVNGILVEVKRSSSVSGATDSKVQLVKGGAISGANRATGAAIPAALTYGSYGGPSDLWGLAFTPADINNATFGAVYQALGTGGLGVTVSVDAIRITVYYTPVDTPSGTVTLAGTVAEHNTVLFQGKVTLAGTRSEAWSTSVSPAGQITLAGADQEKLVIPWRDGLLSRSQLARHPFHLLIGGEDVSWLIDQGVTFSNVDPGGFEVAAFPIPKDMPQAMVGQPVRLDSSLGVAWEGRVSEVQRSLGNRTQITCEGWGARLKETEISEIYVDRDLSHWTSPPLQRQIVYAAQLTGLGPFSVGFTPAGVTPLLILESDYTFQGGSIYSEAPCEVWYDAGAENLIAKVYYSTQALSSGFAGSYNEGILLASDASASVIELGNAAGSGYFAPATAYRYAYAVHQLALPRGTTPQNVSYGWQLAVYGDHGLSLRGPDPGGLYTSDIVRHAISQVPTLGAGIIPDATGYIVPHAAYYQPVTVERIVADMAKYAGCHWGTWDSLDGITGKGVPRVDFRPYPNAATVSCQRADCDTLDLHETLATMYDTAQVAYTDVAGVAQAIIVQLANPYLARVGAHRTIDLQAGTMTSVAATAYGVMVLALMQQQARIAGSAVFTGPVKTAGGTPKPAFMLRSGIDRLRIGDLPGSDAFGTHNDFSVSRVECRIGGDGIQTTVELGTGANLVETLTSRLQEAAQTVGSGGGL